MRCIVLDVTLLTSHVLACSSHYLLYKLLYYIVWCIVHDDTPLTRGDADGPCEPVVATAAVGRHLKGAGCQVKRSVASIVDSRFVK